LFRDSKFNGKNVYLANTFGTLITETSRNHLLSNLLKEVAENRLEVTDKRIQGQFNTFVYGVDTKPRHDTGKNDDLVIRSSRMETWESNYMVDIAKAYILGVPTGKPGAS